jgi:hypothetical protein
LAASAKLEQEQLAKLADVGELQGKLDSSELVAIDSSASVMKAESVGKALEEMDSVRDKAVDVVMATKLPALEKKK